MLLALQTLVEVLLIFRLLVVQECMVASKCSSRCSQNVVIWYASWFWWKPLKFIKLMDIWCDYCELMNILAAEKTLRTTKENQLNEVKSLLILFQNFYKPSSYASNSKRPLHDFDDFHHSEMQWNHPNYYQSTNTMHLMYSQKEWIFYLVSKFMFQLYAFFSPKQWKQQIGHIFH